MKRLHRLVITSFLGPFVMTFFIVLFLLLMQFLWRYIDELVGKGLGFSIIGELLLYTSSSLVPLALPLAILLSSLMTFGNMGEFYELTAIKASGISLRRIMMPVVILVIFISIGAFFFANNVLPVTNLKMKSLLFDVRQQRPEVQITEGVFYSGLDNYSIRVSKKDPVTNLLYDIKIYDHSRNKGNSDITVADSGRMKMTADKRNMVITLWNGYTYSEVDENRRKKEKDYPHRLIKFQEQNIIIEMTGFELSRTDESIWKNSYQMLNLGQLKRASDSIEEGLHFKSREFYNSILENNYFRLTGSEQNPAIASGSPRHSNTANIPLSAGVPVQTAGIATERIATVAEKNGSVALTARKVAAARRTAAVSEKETTGGGSSAIRTNASAGNIDAASEAAVRKAAAKKAATQNRADLEPEDTMQQDTLVNTKPPVIKKPLKKVENFESLFYSYGLQERGSIIRTATNYISMTQYLVVSTGSNMVYETRLLRRHEIEWHRKLTLAFACLIFLFIGAPLGAIIRKGGLGLPTVISTLLFILYYIITLTGEKFVRESVLTAFEGMWLSSFVLVVTGIFLTYQATNDSAILNIDTYLNWIREKAGLRKRLILDKKAHITGRFELIEIPRTQLQEEFKAISDMAVSCIASLKADTAWRTLVKKTFENTEFIYLIEFGVHYNCFIDQTLLSKWYRLPYFQKRLTEFPFINGKVTSEVFTGKLTGWISVIIFPIGILRLLHLRLKIYYISRNLKQLIELSSGMVNLLNSSALRTDAVILS